MFNLTSKVSYIYVLLDENGATRYVGHTTHPGKRYASHLSDRRSGKHKCNWIRSMLSHGLRPTMKVLAIVELNEAPSTEEDYIAALLKAGAKLTNGSKGGEGITTSEARYKAELAIKKRLETTDVRIRLSAEMKKRWQDPIQRQKLLEVNRRPEIRQKHVTAAKRISADPLVREKKSLISKAHWATPGAREQVSQSHMGHPVSEATKAKLSISLNQHYENNPQTRDKQSKIRKQHYIDHPEHRESIAKAQTGRKHSSESIAKQTASIRERCKDPAYHVKCSEAQKASIAANPERREKLSKAISAKYASNPEIRDKISHSVREYWAKRKACEPIVVRPEIVPKERPKISDEARKKLSERAKEQWASDGMRARSSASHKKHFEDPVALVQRSAASKAMWANPDHREKLLSARRSESVREKSRQATINQMAKPGAKERSSEAHKKVQNRPEIREKYAKAARERYSKPGTKEKTSIAQKKRFERPEEQAKLAVARARKQTTANHPSSNV